MEPDEIKRRLASGDYGLVVRDNKRLKSEVWQHFDKVHDENKSPVDFVQCKRCKTEEWLARKVTIDDRHKVATFLWPKFNQLRMLIVDRGLFSFS